MTVGWTNMAQDSDFALSRGLMKRCEQAAIDIQSPEPVYSMDELGLRVVRFR
jgi:hypothetical protein